MLKMSVVVFAATIALTGYAYAQATTTGAPAGDAPMKPEPMSKMMHHHPMHHHHMQRMHHGRTTEKKMTAPAAVQ